MEVAGVLGVTGVPLFDRLLRLPQPKREVVVEDGEAMSSCGGGGGFRVLLLSKQLTPIPAANDND